MAAPLLRCWGFSSCTSFTSKLNVCRCLSRRNVHKSEQLKKLKQPFARCLLLSVAGLKAESFSHTKEKTNLPPNPANQRFSASSSSDQSLTFEPNDPRLKGSECLKNAARLSVDATSAVLSQSVYEIGRIEEEYVKLMNVLVLLMEYQLQVLGHSAEEQRIADLIVETRHEISEIRRRRQDLEFLFASATKLADATAEVAFATGANYASTSAGERLDSATREIQKVRLLSEEVEKRLQMTEVKSIEVLTQHEEKKAKQQQEAEEEQKQQEVELERSETSRVSGGEETDNDKTDNDHDKDSGGESPADQDKTHKKGWFSF